MCKARVGAFLFLGPIPKLPGWSNGTEPIRMCCYHRKCWGGLPLGEGGAYNGVLPKIFRIRHGNTTLSLSPLVQLVEFDFPRASPEKENQENRVQPELGDKVAQIDQSKLKGIYSTCCCFSVIQRKKE